jgi:hypothetical protein
MTGRNPREETEAERAVVLIDPFTDSENPAAPPKSLFGLVSQLFGLFLQQARYKPEDIALAFNESVYSRFLVAPRDRAGTGSWVLASGKLGGFKGFLDRKLLVHDFRLGRYDAYLFLSRDFRFPPNNIVFKERPWSDDQRRIHTSGVYDYTDQPVEERDYLPMIPLMKSLRDAPPVEPTRQPLVALAGSLSGLIDTRLDFVFGKLLEEFSSGGKGVSAGTMRTLVKSAWSLWGRATVRNRVLAALAGALDSPGTD